MTKLIAYYKAPENKDEFEKKYFDEHLPLAKKMPGLLKCEIMKLKGLGGTEPKFFMQADMYFENEDSLNKAMSSEEGRAAGKNLMSFAKEHVTMYIGVEQE
ncbi:MAG: EthD family reductase [Ignavibacteria bacterium]